MVSIIENLYYLESFRFKNCELLTEVKKDMDQIATYKTHNALRYHYEVMIVI